MSQTEGNALFQKYEQVKHSLRNLGKVGVAFSGGIDSSLVLLAAGEALGKKNVTAIHGSSLLNRYETDIEDFFSQTFTGMANLHVVEFDPLSWSDFVCNDSKRCYYCKKKAYSQFFAELKKKNIEVLVDGTNFDDLQEPRAGLAVLQELRVKTPLADAEIGKREVRFLAQSFGLPHYNLPSNSCLATRIKPLSPIQKENLERVAQLEKKLHQRGIYGCRVRPHEDHVIVELREQDFPGFIRKHNRAEFLKYCQGLGFYKVLLDLKGRD